MKEPRLEFRKEDYDNMYAYWFRIPRCYIEDHRNWRFLCAWFLIKMAWMCLFKKES